MVPLEFQSLAQKYAKYADPHLVSRIERSPQTECRSRKAGIILKPVITARKH